MNPNDIKANSTAEGPGSNLQIAERMKPLVDGLDENYYVEILNPLSVDFMGRVSSSRPADRPLTVVTNKMTPTITQTEDDIRRNYGLNLKNNDHLSQVHFAQTVTIPAGKTIRLPGNEAQVIVRQLVNILMDKEGRKLFKGDSFARREIEDRVVIKQGTMSEFFTTQNVDIRGVINEDLHNETEQSFPGATQRDSETNIPSGGETYEPQHGNRRGRPPKDAA